MGRSELRFTGRLRFRAMQLLWSDVRENVGRCGQVVDLDLSGVSAVDGGAIALLLELKSELAERGATVEIVGAQGGVRSMLELYGDHPVQPTQKPPPAHIGILDEIGRATRKLFSGVTSRVEPA